MRTVVVLGCLLGSACAHVKLLVAPADMNIRNAKAAGAEGSFSVSGPCGGSNTWGATGVNDVQDGQQICARINYNGGHSSAANRFVAAVACGDLIGTGAQSVFGSSQSGPNFARVVPLKQVAGVSSPFVKQDTVRNGKADAVNAAVFNSKGLTLCVDLPKQNIAANVADNAQARKCTLSLMDQRGWGGCLDMKISSKAAATPPPIAPQKFKREAAGTYEFKGCDKDTGGTCCLQGKLGVSEDGQVWGKVKAVSFEAFNGLPEGANAAACAEFSDSIKATLAWEGDRAATFSASSTVAAAVKASNMQTFDIVAQDPLKNGLKFSNVGEAAPIVSDGTAVRVSTVQEGVQDGAIGPAPEPLPEVPTVPTPSEPTPAAGADAPKTNFALIGGAVAAVAVVGGALYKMRSGSAVNPNAPNPKYDMEMQQSSRRGSPQAMAPYGQYQQYSHSQRGAPRGW